jgi:hypothetical protein
MGKTALSLPPWRGGRRGLGEGHNAALYALTPAPAPPPSGRRG